MRQGSIEPTPAQSLADRVVRSGSPGLQPRQGKRHCGATGGWAATNSDPTSSPHPPTSIRHRRLAGMGEISREKRKMKNSAFHLRVENRKSRSWLAKMLFRARMAAHPLPPLNPEFPSDDLRKEGFLRRNRSWSASNHTAKAGRFHLPTSVPNGGTRELFLPRVHGGSLSFEQTLGEG